MSNKELHSIIDHYGKDNQKLQVCDELIELQAEIIKDMLGKGNIDALKSEIADVENMLDQLKIIYNISSYEIDEIRLFKMQRTLNIIENGR
jgi:hypothetical protein